MVKHSEFWWRYVMQIVESYNNLVDAKVDMRKHIAAGWRIHTCTMSEVMAGYKPYCTVLVVYEK
jgi:hypothetical protein